MSNNVNSFSVQVKTDLLKEFKKDSIKLSNQIDKLSQNAIEDMNIPDTGLLQLRTFTQFFVNLSSNVVAQVVYNTTRVDYAQKVHEGLGNNSKYGRRNYLEVARDQTLELLNGKPITRVFKQGSKNKGIRKYAKRSF